MIASTPDLRDARISTISAISFADTKSQTPSEQRKILSPSSSGRKSLSPNRCQV
jgi:hypothetical protein